MKQLILSFLLALSTAVGYGQAQEVKINVHPGVELLTIVQKLSGKYPASAPSTYEREVLAYFSPYQKHPAVLKVQQLKGQVFPDLTELGFCFTDSPDLQLAIPDSSSWYKRYGKEEVVDYLRKCQEFARQSNFRQFYSAHATAYPAWGALIKAGIQQDNLLGKLNDFYRSATQPHFYICLDPLNNWGAHAIPNPELFNPVYQGTKAYTLGFFPKTSDSTQAPVFQYGDYATTLVWHEGSHIYLEDLFTRYQAQIASLAYLYNGTDPGMKSQNISTWKYCLNENVVRGIVIALYKQHKTERAWRRQGAQEVLNDFIYANEISTLLLTDYIGHKKYRDFDAFFPVLLAKLQKMHPRKA
jgi:hypothetical protein